MRYVSIAAVCVLCCAVPVSALAAGDALTFGTMSLTHLTAAEVAPLLGGVFRLAGAPEQPVEEPGAASITPPGVKLVTAGHPGSQLLVAYGTQKGLTELAKALAQADAAHEQPGSVPDRVRVSLSLYGGPPKDLSDWTSGPQMAGLTARVKDFGESASLSIRRPRGAYEIGSAFAVVQAGVPEIIALPRFGPLPQIILGMAARINADQTITLAIGVGQGGGKTDPWKVIGEASKMPLAVTVKQRQQLGVALLRGDSGVTLMFTTSKVEPPAEEPPGEGPTPGSQ